MRLSEFVKAYENCTEEEKKELNRLWEKAIKNLGLKIIKEEREKVCINKKINSVIGKNVVSNKG